MARPLRIEFDGAWYHVINRGSGRKDLFTSDEERERFLELLGDLADSFWVETHAYCLMRNHYHLLLHTPLGNLGHGMQHLNGVYTQFPTAIKAVTVRCFGAATRPIWSMPDRRLSAPSCKLYTATRSKRGWQSVWKIIRG